MTNLLHIIENEKFVAAHKKCPKIPLGSSCAKIAYFWSEMILAFLCADSSIQNASEKFLWCIQFYL